MPMRLEFGPTELEDNFREVERQFIDFLLVFYQALTTGTPVDTGHARVNWLIDFGAFLARVIGSRPEVPGRQPRSGALIQAPSNDKIKTWRVSSGNVFIHNSVEYIEFLEDGSSAQAEQGMIMPALAAAEAAFG